MTGEQPSYEADEIEAYVLGTLSREAATAFEVRLASSPALRAAVRRARAVTVLLAESAPPVDPLPNLKDRLMAAVRAETRRPAATPAAEPESIRHRALDLAETMLAEHGYDRLSLAAVARGLGVEEDDLLAAFPGGKDELVLAVIERRLDEDGRHLAAAIASAPDSHGQLRAIAAWWIGERQGAGVVLREVSRALPEAHRARARAAFMTHLNEPLQGIMRAGIERGELRPQNPQLSALVFLGLLSEFGSLPTSPQAHGLATSPADLADQLTAMFLSGVGGQGPAG